VSDSYAYALKEGLSDTAVLDGVRRIRSILDTLRHVRPEGLGMKKYLESYDDMQACYAAALTEARRRGLALPEWEGDGMVFSQLVDDWIRVDDYRP